MSFKDLIDNFYQESGSYIDNADPILNKQEYFNLMDAFYLRSDQESEEEQNKKSDEHGIINSKLDYIANYSIQLEDLYETFGPKENIYKTIPYVSVIDSEVGDDHIQLTDAPLTFLSELLTAKDLFSIQISEKDTFISSRCGNYSENFMLIPDNKSEIFTGKSINEKHDTVFLDIAKIRTILPVVSMRQKHSDTLDGKVSLLGKSAVYDSSLCGPLIRLSMCYQNICLNLNKEYKFPYMPTYLGGLGSQMPFNSPSNVLRTFMTYKNGKYYNLLCTIIQNMNDLYYTRDKDAKVFLTQIKTHAEYWHDWYKLQSKFVPDINGKVGHQYNEFIVGQYGNDEIWDNAARRLLSAHVLVTDEELLINETIEDFNKVLLMETDLFLTREILEVIRKNMRNDRLVYSDKFLNANNIDQFGGPLVLTKDSIALFLSIADSRNEVLRNIIKSNVLYWKAALDRVKRTGPLNVCMQYLAKNGYMLPVEKEHFILLDDETLKVVKWFKELAESGENQPRILELKLSAPREIISDDPVIKLRIREFVKNGHHDKAVIIVTSDKNLCYHINDSLVIPVFRIDPTRTEDDVVKIGRDLKDFYHKFQFHVEYDLGSIKSANDKFTSNMKGFRTRIIQRLDLRKFWNSEEKRKGILVHHNELKLQPDNTYDRFGVLSGRENQIQFKKKVSVTNPYDYTMDGDDNETTF